MEALARVEIDLAALARNYRALADAALPGACGAVVKADAYGLGVGPVAGRLHAAGCRHFFVATPTEGVELRQLSPGSEIYVLDGLAGAEADELVVAGLTPVLNTRAEIARWRDAGPAAIQVDSGINRLGLTAVDIDALEAEPELIASLDIRYVLTHLACADEPEHALNPAQRERFEHLRRLWPEAKTSVANSAGILLGEAFVGDLARPGIGLYGGNPFSEGNSSFEPVVKVLARVLQIKDIEAGSTLGYGATFVADKPIRVATVALGYADGYPRSLGNCGVAEVAGSRVPVIGRVSMDLVCLDVSAVPDDAITEGDWATMIGGGVPLDELAAAAGTIGYELLTAIGSRVERIYVDG